MTRRLRLVSTQGHPYSIKVSNCAEDTIGDYELRVFNTDLVATFEETYWTGSFRVHFVVATQVSLLNSPCHTCEADPCKSQDTGVLFWTSDVGLAQQRTPGEGYLEVVSRISEVFLHSTDCTLPSLDKVFNAVQP